MIKVLLFFMIFFSQVFCASAVNWTAIDNNSPNNRVYIDSSSIKVDDFANVIGKNPDAPIIISAVFKFDNLDEDVYKIVPINFYSTGWVKSGTVTVYHKGTGRILKEFDLPPEKGERRIVNGTLDEKIYNNLFSQYKDRKNKHDQELKLKVAQYEKEKEFNRVLHFSFVFIGFVIFIEALFRVIIKNKSFGFGYRIEFYILSIFAMALSSNILPIYKNNWQHFIAESLDAILGYALIPGIITLITFIVIRSSTKDSNEE